MLILACVRHQVSEASLQAPFAAANCKEKGYLGRSGMSLGQKDAVSSLPEPPRSFAGISRSKSRDAHQLLFSL